MFSRRPRTLAPRLDLRSLRYHHAVFPDLATSGGRHRINFAPGRPQVTPSADPALSDDERDFADWLFRQTAQDARIYRPEGLKRRIPSLLRALRVGSIREARTLLERDPRQLDAALSVMVIGVTRFFRDANVFAAVREHLLNLLPNDGRPRHIASMGCSSGAELYSVAILLAEQGVLQNFSLCGLDCRRDAIAAASAGVFDEDFLREVPPEMRSKYFMHAGAGRRRVVPWLASNLNWRLTSVPPAGPAGGYDMILCRNMAIYLEPFAVEELWSQLAGRLAPGGILVVGKAERPSSRLKRDRRRGELRAIGSCLYQWSGE